MSDRLGLVEIPTGAAVDPALQIVADFMKATLNVYALAAWHLVAPNRLPVARVWTHEPRDFCFNERDLPALFVTRPKGVHAWPAIDWCVATDDVLVQWVFPNAQQATQRVRDNVTSDIGRVVHTLIERGRDASYVKAGDADPEATTLAAAPTTIKLSIATSTSPQTYAGAALNGAVGAGAVSPARPVTVTLSGSVAAWNVGSAITISGTDALGYPQTSTLTVVAPPAVLTTHEEYVAVTSVAVAAQASTAGTWTAGLGAFVGAGTDLLKAAGFMSLSFADWKDSMVAIQMAAPAPARTYDAVELRLRVEELLVYDLTDTTRFQPTLGADLILTNSDTGAVIERAAWPDNAPLP